MSISLFISHLQTSLPSLTIAQPGVIDLPARKQQDAHAFYGLLQPLFGEHLYPLTAKASDSIRPTPDGVYGVVKSEQRTYLGKSVATLIGFSLEIRATSYAAVVAQEDLVRAALASTTGVETVGAFDDYADDSKLFVSVLEIELSAPIADVLVMEVADSPADGTSLCTSSQMIDWRIAVILCASSALEMQAHRDLVRMHLHGWKNASNSTPLALTSGEALAMDCGLFVWVDNYRCRKPAF